ALRPGDRAAGAVDPRRLAARAGAPAADDDLRGFGEARPGATAVSVLPEGVRARAGGESFGRDRDAVSADPGEGFGVAGRRTQNPELRTKHQRTAGRTGTQQTTDNRWAHGKQQRTKSG